MTTGSYVASLSALVLVLTAGSLTNAASAQPNPASPAKVQITILYDAFGQNSAMHKDWGYAALIEYGGKRILFDTGNDPDIFAENARVKGNRPDQTGLRRDVASPRRPYGGIELSLTRESQSRYLCS
jgi:hypothetical protein